MRFYRNNYLIHLLTSLRLVSVKYYYPYFSDEEIGSPSATFSSTAILFFNTTRNLMDVLQKMQLEAAFLVKERRSPSFQFYIQDGMSFKKANWGGREGNKNRSAKWNKCPVTEGYTVRHTQ